jgi:cyclopropane fatty-acyl-phospholipid synthase-like methyltransferase
MFKTRYTEQELNNLIESTEARRGWDFSKMNTQRQTVPWEYLDVIGLYVHMEDAVLDVGTGGGERFSKLSKKFKKGIGVDPDPEMIRVAQENVKAQGIGNMAFYQDTEMLEQTPDAFNMIICRHAPYNIKAINAHLEPHGYFITQTVGQRNMRNIKQVINQDTDTPIITREEFEGSGLRVLAFMEYDVEYVVKDVESLVFWLQALDAFHADIKKEENYLKILTFLIKC